MSGFDQCPDHTQQAGPLVSGFRKGRGGVLGGMRWLPPAGASTLDKTLQDLRWLFLRIEDFVLRYGVASQPMALNERANS
jgi:hypothetical protein